jgi:phosphonate transport system substrate-binding protein
VISWGFGVVRAEVVHAAQSVVAELCNLATAAVGERFVPQFATSYTELAHALEVGTIGLAWMPPIPAVEIEESGVGVVLAVPARKGMATYHSALITRKGGPRDLKACEGRGVAWVDEQSASGYVIPRLHCASLGIDARTFFGKELFARTHIAVVDAVVSGRVGVGATYCNFDASGKRVTNAGWTDPDGGNPRPIEMLTSAGPIPNDAIVGSAKLPLPLRAALTRWLIGLEPRGRELFQQLLRATEFRVLPAAHFTPLKHIVRTARARGFSMVPPAK